MVGALVAEQDGRPVGERPKKDATLLFWLALTGLAGHSPELCRLPTPKITVRQRRMPIEVSIRRIGLIPDPMPKFGFLDGSRNCCSGSER